MGYDPKSDPIARTTGAPPASMFSQDAVELFYRAIVFVITAIFVVVSGLLLAAATADRAAPSERTFEVALFVATSCFAWALVLAGKSVRRGTMRRMTQNLETRLRQAACLACGYPMAASESDVCPECGWRRSTDKADLAQLDCLAKARMHGGVIFVGSLAILLAIGAGWLGLLIGVFAWNADVFGYSLPAAVLALLASGAGHEEHRFGRLAPRYLAAIADAHPANSGRAAGATPPGPAGNSPGVSS